MKSQRSKSLHEAEELVAIKILTLLNKWFITKYLRWWGQLGWYCGWWRGRLKLDLGGLAAEGRTGNSWQGAFCFLQWGSFFLTLSIKALNKHYKKTTGQHHGRLYPECVQERLKEQHDHQHCPGRWNCSKRCRLRTEAYRWENGKSGNTFESSSKNKNHQVSFNLALLASVRQDNVHILEALLPQVE